MENGVREPHCHARSGGVLVAFFHLRYGVIGVPLFDLYIFQFRFGNRGYLWVDFFFILSGFILAYRYGDACSKLNPRGYGHFVWQAPVLDGAL
jgi:peptidoglycan/LPS O-acetylase OafA/YrhL